jgi:cytoskeleton protein RodZ
MPSLGQELKKIREERGVSLRQISDATHIGMRFLQAIESDSYDALPGGIFTRSFVRKYANYVGLDEGQVLARYDQQVADLGGEAPKTPAPRYEDFEVRNSSGGSLRLVLPVLLLLGILLYFTYQYIQKQAAGSGGPESNPAALAQTPTPPPTATPEAAPSPTPPASPAVSPSPAGALRLQLTARDGACWVKVKADEDEAVTRTLQQGDTADFVASEKLLLHLGNLPAVSVTLNGRPVKLTPTRGRTVVEDMVITKDNYQKFIE